MVRKKKSRVFCTPGGCEFCQSTKVMEEDRDPPQKIWELNCTKANIEITAKDLLPQPAWCPLRKKVVDETV